MGTGPYLIKLVQGSSLLSGILYSSLIRVMKVYPDLRTNYQHDTVPD